MALGDLGNIPAKAERQRQIPEQMEIQKNELLRLEKACSNLKERIAPASEPSPPSAKGEEDKNALVPIAEELRENNCRINFVVNELEGMINRLEL